MMKDMFVIIHVNNFKSLISQLSLARTIIIDVRDNISYKIEEHGSMAIMYHMFQGYKRI
jgi:hypothetical protein